MTSSKPQFQWDDPFFLEAQLSDEERMVRDAAKAFADDILMPRVIGDFRDEAFDPALLKDSVELPEEKDIEFNLYGNKPKQKEEQVKID
mgnify:CR=1 FL=1